MATLSEAASKPQLLEHERATLAAAQAGNAHAFERLIAPYRVGLHLHCYRMLGELYDADDALQETLLRAWRGLGRFQPRAPVRSWLYRIATNVCLTAIARRIDRSGTAGGRPLLDDVAGHVGPYPDRLLEGSMTVQPGPDMVLERDESVQLALIAAVQALPARQRAVLLLRDVLDFSASEVADLLETSVAAVNSALQRARSTVERERRAGRIARMHAPTSDSVERELGQRLADKWRAADVQGLVRLLAEDALLTMPPQPLRVIGRAAIRRFLDAVPAPGQFERFRVLETGANCQPALALYLADLATGAAHAYAVLVLSIEGDEITSLTRFGDTRIFAALGLPTTLEE